MKRIVFLAIGVFFLHQSLAQLLLVDANTRCAKKALNLHYKKYRLANGLIILLDGDHYKSDVIVNITYRVGSANDAPGKSGQAHFFEHLMFQGSRHIEPGQHIKLVTEMGGTIRAQTYEDKTSFTNIAPAGALERLLWLESDRMGFWLTSFDETKFAVQKQVILNERMQNVENSVSAQLQEIGNINYYPANHPYRMPIIGLRQDLENMTYEDLITFYRKYYHPGNAILTIAGNFKEKDALKWVEKYFGRLKGQIQLNELAIKENKNQNGKTILIKNKSVTQSYLLLKFPSVPRYTKNYAEMECIGYILGGSENNYLSTWLKNRNDFANIVAYNYSQRSGGQFSIIGNLNAGKDPTDFAGLVLEAIKSFKNIPKKQLEDLITEFKRRTEFRKTYEIQSVDGRVNNLIGYEIILGKPDFIQEELDQYMSVNANTVMRVFTEYFLNGMPFTLEARSAANETSLQKYYPQQITDLKMDRKCLPPVIEELSDTFDRQKMPPLVTRNSSRISKEGFWYRNLKNGIKIIGDHDPIIPVVSMNIHFNNLTGVENNRSVNIAKMLSSILFDCPTTHYTTEEIKKKQNRYGIYYYVGAENNSVYLQIKCLEKYFDQALDIVQEKILYPVITDSFLSEKEQKIFEEAENKKKDISYAAYELFKTSNLQNRSTNSDTISQSIIHDFFCTERHLFRNISPTQIKIVINGKITKNAALKKMQFLSRIRSNKTLSSKKDTPCLKTDNDTQIYCYDIPETGQVAIKCGYYLEQPYDYDSLVFRLSLANYILGGYFYSRINSNLREKNGYTYKAFSYITPAGPYTQFYIETLVDSKVLNKALKEIIKEVDSFSVNGISKEELLFLKTSFSYNNPFLNEFRYDKMKFMKMVVNSEVPEKLNDIQLNILEKISIVEINQLIARFFSSSKLKIILVGNKKLIDEQLNNFRVKLSQSVFEYSYKRTVLRN